MVAVAAASAAVVAVAEAVADRAAVVADAAATGVVAVAAAIAAALAGKSNFYVWSKRGRNARVSFYTAQPINLPKGLSASRYPW